MMSNKEENEKGEIDFMGTSGVKTVSPSKKKSVMKKKSVKPAPQKKKEKIMARKKRKYTRRSAKAGKTIEIVLPKSPSAAFQLGYATALCAKL